MVTTLLVALSAFPYAPTQDEIHPAFLKTPEQFAAAWKIGEEDAKRRANPDSRLNKFRRGIGSIRTSVVDSETVSWVYFIAPEFHPYIQAFQGVKQYKSEAEMAPIKVRALPTETVVFESMHFYGYITLMPSFGAGYGRIDRYADPNDLSDVRVVIKIGDRVLQPVKHPGNMLQRKRSSLNLFSIPRYQYSTTSSYASGSAYGSGGYVYGSASGTSTTVSSYVEHSEEGYSWYQGEFFVEFNLLDSDGIPLIASRDKEFELIVIYGNNERKAKYKLSELENAIK
jgi:hypothetical protein